MPMATGGAFSAPVARAAWPPPPSTSWPSAGRLGQGHHLCFTVEFYAIPVLLASFHAPELNSVCEHALIDID
jgi:hypothetical protein